MKVTKWVEYSQEVEVEIGADDVRAAISEAFARVEKNIDDTPNRHDVMRSLAAIGRFLRGMTDEHISLVGAPARKTVAAFLSEQAKRFEER